MRIHNGKRGHVRRANVLLAGLILGAVLGFDTDVRADAGGDLGALRQIGRELAQIAERAYPGVAALRVEETSSVEALRESLRRRGSRGGRERPIVPGGELRAPRQYRFSDPEALPELYAESDLRQEARRMTRPEELRVLLRGMPTGQRRQGLGIIVSAEGHIATNYHVVNDANSIEVRLADGRSLAGKVVGADKATDIAVVKIDAENLEPLEFGDSDGLALGDWLIGIGNPMGMGRTFRVGMVTGKHRHNLGLADFEDFLQTDAAPGLGDGGGPLLDLEGKVVGMSTAVLGAERGAAIGLAIPANVVKTISTQLVESGSVARGFLGIALAEIDAERAQVLGLEAATGVLVTDVIDNSPAARAGLEQNDVIVELNGETIRSTWQLRYAVAGQKPETEVEIVVVREGARKTLTVTLGQRPSG